MSGRGDDGPEIGGGGGVGPMAMPMAVPWRKPWWRSVGFWIGAWGLAFLVWVWVDSYPNISRVAFPVTMEAPGYGVTGAGREVMLQGGRVIVGRKRISDPPMGITVSKGRAIAEYRKGTNRFPVTTWWGTDRWVDEAGNPFAGMSVEVLVWWFPFGVVVAGYVAVWAGSLVLWRRWMRRRVLKGTPNIERPTSNDE